MADRVVVEIDNFESFNKLLDKIILKLDKLDAGLNAVTKTSARISFKITGLDDLERLLNLSTKSGGAASLKPFRALVEIATLVGQSSVLLKGVKADSFTNLEAAVNSLARSSLALSTVPVVKAAVLNNYTAIVASLGIIAQKTKSLSVLDFQKLPVIVGAFGVVAERVNAIGGGRGLLTGAINTRMIQQFVATLSGLETIGRSAKKLEGVDFSKLPKVFTELSAAFSSFNSSSSGIAGLLRTALQLRNVGQFVDVVAQIARVAAAAAKVTPESMTHMGVIFQALGVAMNALRLKTGSIEDLLTSFVSGKALDQLLVMIQILVKVSAAAVKIPIANFSNLVLSIGELQRVMDAIGLIRTGRNLIGLAINDAFLRVVLNVVNVVKAISTSSGQTDIQKITDFQASIAALANLSKVVDSKALTNSINLIKKMGEALGTITKNVIKEGIIDEFITVGVVFQRVSSSFERIVITVKTMSVNIFGHNAEMDRAAKLFKQFARIMTDLIDAVFSTSKPLHIFWTQQRSSQAINVESLAALADIIGAIGRSFDLVVNATHRVNTKGILAYSAQSLSVFSSMRQGLVMIVSVLDDQRTLWQKITRQGKSPIDPNQLLALAKLMTSLASILTKVFASFNQFSGSSFDKRDAGARDIKARVSFLSDLMDSFKGFRGKELPDNLVKVMSRIPVLLRTLADITATPTVGKNTVADALKGSAQALSDFFKALGKIDPKKAAALADIGVALKAFASLKALGDMSAIVTSVNTLFVAINTTKIDPKSFENLRKVSEELAKAMQALVRIPVDPNQAAALQALVTMYTNLSKANIQPIATSLMNIPATEEAGLKTGTSFAKSIQKGVFGAGIKLLVVKYFFDLAKAVIGVFNPVGLFVAFKTGIEGILHFGQSLIQFWTSLSTKVTQIAQQLAQFGQRMVTLGQQVMRQFGVQALLSSQAFASAVDFDTLLTKVKVFGTLTVEQLDRVRKAAVQVGIDFPQSAAEALTAGLSLIKAGLSDIETTFALPVIAALTNLSDSGDMEAISKGVIQIVNSFDQLKPGVASTFENVSVAADVLSSVADNTTSSVESLIEGMGNVAPVARAMGEDFQQTAAVLGLFSDNGIQGAEAGTQLKSLLTNLNSAVARKELMALGVSLVDAKGDFRSLNDVVNDLQKALLQPKTEQLYAPGTSPTNLAALKIATAAYASAQRNLIIYSDDLQSANLSEEDRNNKLANFQRIADKANDAIVRYSGSTARATSITREITRTQQANAISVQKLAGRYGQLGLNILLSQDENAINDFIAQINLMPTALERARQLMDNFAGDTEQLKGSLETLGINALQPLLESYFRPFVQLLRQVVDGILQLDPVLAEMGGWVAALVTTLGTLGGAGLIVTGTLVRIGAGLLAAVGPLLSLTHVAALFVGVAGSLLTGLAALVVVVLPLAVAFTTVAATIALMHKAIVENVSGAGTAFMFLRTSAKASLGAVSSVLQAVVGLLRMIFTGGTGTGGFSLKDVGVVFRTAFIGLDRVLEGVTAKLTSISAALGSFASVFSSSFSGSQWDVFGKLGNNPILAWIFKRKGLPISPETIGKFVTEIQLVASSLRGGLGSMGASLRQFVSDLGSGLSLETAFATLRNSFKKNFGDVSADLLFLVSDLFSIDFSSAIRSLRAGNLSEGLRAFVGVLVGGIKTFLLNNRKPISRALTSLFDLIFVPGGFLETVTGWLGLTQLHGVIATLRDLLVGGFQGIVETIFNLLAGNDLPTALRQAFGPGIEPVLTFVTELGTAVDTVLGIIGSLLSGIFDPGAKNKGGATLSSVVTGALEGVNAALSALNKNVLIPLKAVIDSIDFVGVRAFFDSLFKSLGDFTSGVLSGDWEKAATGLGTSLSLLMGALVKAVASLFGSGAKTADGKQMSFMQTIADGVVRAIQGALTLALGTLGTLLHLDMTTFYAGMKTAFAPLISGIETGDPSLIVGGLGTAVLGVVKNAILLALSGIGAALGLDTTATIASISGFFDTLSTQIGSVFDGENSVFVSATNIIKDLVAGVQALLDLVGKNKPDLKNSVFTTISDFFNSVPSAVATALTAPLRAIQSLLDRVAKMDMAATTAFFGAMTTFLGALALVQVLKSSGSLLQLFTNFKLMMGSPLVKGAAIFVFIDFLANVIDSFSKVKKFDFAGILQAVVDTFTGFASDLGLTAAIETIARLFRFQDSQGKPFADHLKNIGVTVMQLRVVLGVGLAQIGTDITNFLANLSAQFLLTLNTINLKVKEAKESLLSGTSTRETSQALVDGLFSNLATAFSEQKIDIAAMLAQTLIHGEANGVDPLLVERTRLLARTNMTALLGVFGQEVAAIDASGTPAQIDAFQTNLVSSFVGIGSEADVAQAVNRLFASGNLPLVKSFLDGLMTAMTSPDPSVYGLNNANFITMGGHIRDALVSALQTGSLDPGQAQTILDLVTINGDITPADSAALQTEIDRFKANLAIALQIALDSQPPVVPLPITLKPEVTNGTEPTDPFAQGLQKWVDDHPPIALDAKTIVTVTPTDTLLDVSQVQTQADADGLALSLDQAAASMLALQTQTALSSPDIVIQVGLMSAVFLPFATTMQTALVAIRDDFSTVIARVYGLSGVLTLTAPLVVVSSAVIQGALSGMVNGTISQMDRLLQKFGDVEAKLNTILSQIAQVNSAVVNPPAGLNGGSPRRASGGPVNAGQPYQVLEKRLPELFKRGSDFYFLSPDSGRVIPLSKAQLPRLQAGGAGGGGSTQITYSPQTTIQVSGSNLDMQQLTQAVAARVDQSNSQQAEDIQRLLRRHGRSGA